MPALHRRKQTKKESEMKELSEASLEETIRKINEMVKDGEKLINLQPTQVWFPFQPTEEQLASARVLLKDVK